MLLHRINIYVRHG